MFCLNYCLLVLGLLSWCTVLGLVSVLSCSVLPPLSGVSFYWSVFVCYWFVGWNFWSRVGGVRFPGEVGELATFSRCSLP